MYASLGLNELNLITKHQTRCWMQAEVKAMLRYKSHITLPGPYQAILSVVSTMEKLSHTQ